MPWTSRPILQLLPSYAHYATVDRNDPVRFYYWPGIGALYRRRVELCLAECRGGQRILEVGFGSGVTFLNLSEMYSEIHGLDLCAPVEAIASVFRARGIETHLRNGDILQMPYANGFFDTVLLISILEHIKPDQHLRAFQEIRRVLKLGGQAVYGVPVERPLMAILFRLLGYNIREHHFSSEKDVYEAACQVLKRIRIVSMKGPCVLLGAVYEIGHFVKA